MSLPAFRASPARSGVVRYHGTVPRVLLLDPDPRSRLACIAALSASHAVELPETHADPVQSALRTLRRTAVDVVLLAGAQPQAASITRSIRTETSGRAHPPVGVVVAARHPLGPETAIGSWGAEGWLGDPAMVDLFVERLLAGPLPVTLGEHRPSLGGRIWHRLRGITR